MIAKHLMSAEELLNLPEHPDVRYELSNGKLIEVAGTTIPHGLIVALALWLIDGYARERDLGVTLADGVAYLLRRNPDTVRIPNLSFIAWERVPATGFPEEGYWAGVPDLALEVVSPTDRAEEIHNKVQEYLEAGVVLVWVLWPRRKMVTVHAPGIDGRELRAEEVLDGGRVLPGFTIRVAELFAIGRAG